MPEDDREQFVEPETPVVQGDDDIPRQPAPPRDPFTPEPGRRPGERRAFRVMWVAVAVLLALVALVLYAALR